MFGASLADPAGFWGEAAAAIDWDEPYTQLIDESSAPFYSWFGGGKLSMCYNAVDRHLAERAAQAAIIYDSPVTGVVQHISYAELHEQVAKTAGMLTALGVELGDRVVVYMPMIPEAIYAMLACARIGAVHSVVFGGFAAPELAVRIDDAQPVAVLTASCGIEGEKIIDYMPLLDRAIEIAESKPRAVVVKQRPQSAAPLTAGRDHDWDESVSAAPMVDCVSVPSNHPLCKCSSSFASSSASKEVAAQTSCTPPAQRASPRASCATRPHTPWPSSGRCRSSCGRSRARPTGRRAMLAGSWATRTSSTGRCCTAARRSSTRASPSAPRTPALSGASSSSTRL